MSDERTHHVTLGLARDYEFVADFDDIPDAASIRFDEPEPLGGNRAPNAAAVLGAAVGNCLSASLAFCLRRAHVPVDGLTAHVATHVARNDKGRFRISDIEVELVPEVGEIDTARFRRCQELFEDFCIVTESVRQGIPVNVSIRHAERFGEPTVAGVGAAARSAGAPKALDDQC
jgi:organic hydroperoxide reductase OsmC/OhrA